MVSEILNQCFIGACAPHHCPIYCISWQLIWRPISRCFRTEPTRKTEIFSDVRLSSPTCHGHQLSSSIMPMRQDAEKISRYLFSDLLRPKRVSLAPGLIICHLCFPTAFSGRRDVDNDHFAWSFHFLFNKSSGDSDPSEHVNRESLAIHFMS